MVACQVAAKYIHSVCLSLKIFIMHVYVYMASRLCFTVNLEALEDYVRLYCQAFYRTIPGPLSLLHLIFVFYPFPAH